MRIPPTPTPTATPTATPTVNKPGTPRAVDADELPPFEEALERSQEPPPSRRDEPVVDEVEIPVDAASQTSDPSSITDPAAIAAVIPPAIPPVVRAAIAAVSLTEKPTAVATGPALPIPEGGSGPVSSGVDPAPTDSAPLSGPDTSALVESSIETGAGTATAVTAASRTTVPDEVRTTAHEPGVTADSRRSAPDAGADTANLDSAGNPQVLADLGLRSADAPSRGPAARKPVTPAAGPREATSPVPAAGPAAPQPSTPLTASALLNAAPTSVPVAQQLITHLATVRRGADGGHETTLLLSPQELGAVRIRLQVADGQVALHFTGQHAAACEALRDAMPDLRRELADAGLVLTDSEVSQQGAASGHDRSPRGEEPVAWGMDEGRPVDEERRAHGMPSLTPPPGRHTGLVDVLA